MDDEEPSPARMELLQSTSEGFTSQGIVDIGVSVVPLQLLIVLHECCGHHPHQPSTSSMCIWPWDLLSLSFLVRALFTSSLNHEDKKDVRIPGISGECLDLIIDYAYTRQTSINDDNVTEVSPWPRRRIG